MSCAVFTVFGTVVAYFNKSNAWAVRGIFSVSIVLLFVACFLAWLDQHKELEAEREKLKNQTPRLKGRILAAYWETPTSDFSGLPFFGDSQYYVKLDLVNHTDAPCTISCYQMSLRCDNGEFSTKQSREGATHLQGILRHFSEYRDALTSTDSLLGCETRIVGTRTITNEPLRKGCAQEVWVGFYIEKHAPAYESDGPDWRQEAFSVIVTDSLGGSHTIEVDSFKVFKGHLDKV